MIARITSVLRDLVAFDTTATERAAQEHLAAVLERAGFGCTLQEVAPERPNLIAARGDGGTFVCSHIDVHPPHGHPAPFTLREQGELLVGRGALDAKGQIAALVAAVEAEPDAPVTIAITCDEEAGGLGSEHLDMPDGPWRQDGGIVLEPTAFRIGTAQAGNVDVRVAVSGVPGHAYADVEGGSPVHAVLAAIEELDTCRFLKTDHALLGPPRRNIGVVRGGEHAWRRPGRAEVELTFGLVPPTTVEEAEREISDRLDELARRWGSRQTSFLYEICDTSEPIEVPPGLPVASRLADAAGTALEPAGMTSWSDAGNLLVHHGIPCVVFGAGDLAVAHSDHEWVRAADLARLAAILRAVLRRS